MRSLRLVLALAVAWPASGVAQETTGGVRGRLHSAAIGPVSGAHVVATSPDLLGERVVLSAADGVFQFSLLPPGTYTLRVTAIGHRPLVIQDVHVRLGRIAGLGDVALGAAAIELGELSITAPAITLDPVRTTVGATLTAEDYALLPAERDYKSAIAILPHVNPSPHGDPVNVGGSTGLENMYFIDGMNVTSPLNATTGTSLPYNFVRAVEVKAGGYEAQYGRALGAVVNAITYSGTNSLEAQVFGFLTHDVLAAEPKALPALREVGAMSYDVGARVSGPIARDRLWFSAAYNPRVNIVDKELPGFGVYTDESMAHIFAGKVTWAVTPRISTELSLFGDPTVRHEVTPYRGAPTLVAAQPDPFLRRLQSGGVTGAFRLVAAPGPRVVLEAGLAYSSGAQSILAETNVGASEALYLDFAAGSVSGGVGPTWDVTQGRTSGVLRATFMPGRHVVVGGLEYEDTRVDQTIAVSGRVVIYRNDTAAWVTDEQAMTGRFHNRVPTAYVQDAWRLTDRLTVSAGLRWSSQLLTGASGGTAQRFPDEWQPRIGFGWELGREGKQRLFGSYGRFYQQIPLNLSTLWYVDYTWVISHYSSDPRQPAAMPDSLFDQTTYEDDWAQSIDGLAVENFDEFTLGLERLLGATSRLTTRGIRRQLRSSFQWGLDDSFGSVLGTPGRGAFAFLPRPKREYTALEVALDGSIGRLAYRASYVLSRTWGNYSGLYWSDGDWANPGGNFTFWVPWQAANSTGLLPNDRTHVLKVTAGYRPSASVAFGGFLTFASGIPKNDFGVGNARLGVAAPLFLVPRGSAGRTAALWDLNLRAAYRLPLHTSVRGRLILDVLHVGNPRGVVQVDEQHFFAIENGQQVNGNPNYLAPTGYQPPMTARIGVEVSF